MTPTTSSNKANRKAKPPCIYYKVVSRINNCYYSALIQNKQVRQRYYLNRWNKSPVGGLLVFTNFQDAKDFAIRNHVKGARIFTCECKGRMNLPPVRKAPYILTPESRAWVWNEPHEGESNRHVWPKGSRAFRQVRLIYKVC